MRVLLDTNVMMDFLVERDSFDDAKKIITATTNQEMFECILATAVTDIAYLMRVNTNPKVDLLHQSSISLCKSTVFAC